MALWNIIGKAVEKPIYKLIGGRYRDHVECRYWICGKPPKDQAAEAVKAVDAGFKALKIKVGLNPEYDMTCVKAVREAVGDRIEIGIDFNGGYTAGHACIRNRQKDLRNQVTSSLAMNACMHIQG